MFTMGAPLWGGPGDPYISSVVTLLHFNDAPGTTIPVASVGTPTITNGSPVTDLVSATSPKFGSGCWQGGDTSLTGLVVEVSTGAATPYTIEFWIKPIAFGSYYNRFFGVIKVGTGHQFSLGAPTGSTIYYLNEDTYQEASTGSLTVGVWKHVAICYSAGTVTVYLDGVSIYTSSASGWAQSLSAQDIKMYIGRSGGIGGNDGSYYFDDFRWTHGVSRYPGEAFPTAEFPDS